MPVTPAEFWDRIAPGYSRQPVADPASYARKLAATQALMRPDMTVLELGCGTGSTALAHAPHVARIDATDLSAAMIAIASEKARAAGVANVRFWQSSVKDFAMPERPVATLNGEAGDEAEGYDMVLALNLLHLVPDRAAALATIHRLLKPGGIFVSSTVCLADRMWFLRPVIAVMRWLGKAPHVSFAGEKDILREVAQAGFEAREYWTHGRAKSLFLVACKVQVGGYAGTSSAEGASPASQRR